MALFDAWLLCVPSCTLVASQLAWMRPLVPSTGWCMQSTAVVLLADRSVEISYCLQPVRGTHCIPYLESCAIRFHA